ncbi:MAG TPA: hypothetical protein VKV15_04580 [Bryobacteraceae bacterium]|nr:hypothetical protein [Bryobacteraceae bacterium]
MKQSNRNLGTAIGLDVGTSRIVMAHRTGDDFQYDTQLNAFVSIPHSKITESVLQKEEVPYTVRGAEIIVHGNESEKFAELLNAETRRTMTHGVLDAKETESLSVIRQLIASLAGPALAGSAKDKQKLCFTVPAASLGAEENLTYHEGTIRQLLAELGYDVKSINEGLAVVYAEMESSNYSGIGVSCGGGLCNVCLAYLSVPVLNFSIPKAGDYIDSSAAQVTGERANRIRLAKEDSFHFNGSFPDKMHQVLSVYYDDMIQTLVSGMTEAFAKTRSMPKLSRPIPIVLAGGTALPAGFQDRFEKILRANEFPLEVSEIRMAASPLHTTAKGALVAALSDMQQ